MHWMCERCFCVPTDEAVMGLQSEYFLWAGQCWLERDAGWQR